MASAAIEIKEVKPNVPKPDAAAAVKDIDQSILQWIRAVDDLIREERTRTARATARAQTKIEELVDDTLRELEHTEPGVTPTNVRIPRSEKDLNDLAEEWMTDMARIVREENDRSIKLNEERRYGGQYKNWNERIRYCNFFTPSAQGNPILFIHPVVCLIQ